MRKLLSPIAVALYVAAALPVYAQADVLPTETQVRQLADKAMSAAGKGQTDDAYAIIAPYSLTDVTSFERARVSARASRLRLEQYLGTSVGYEFIRSETVGASLLKLTYVEKTEKQALPWEFIFYKTTAGWALSALSNGDDVNTLFDR